MQLPTPPLPFGTTFALTMSITLFMASFELALCDGGAKRKILHNALQETLAFGGLQSCGNACEKCGKHKTIEDSMVLIKVAHFPHFWYNYATVIGQRLILSSGKNRWLGSENANFRWVFVGKEDHTFVARELTMKSRVKKYTIMTIDGTDHHIVLVELTNNLPSSIVPACLPLPSLMTSVANTKFNVPVYTVIEEGYPYIVRISQETLQSDAIKGGIVKLKQYCDSGKKIASGAGVMHKVGQHDILYGILQQDGDNYFIVPVHEFLETIDKFRNGKCLCKQPEAETPKAQ